MKPKYWVWWPEQCEYCQHRQVCENKSKVKDYMKALRQVEDTGIYGTLTWWCDYFILDDEEYWRHNLGECEV